MLMKKNEKKRETGTLEELQNKNKNTVVYI